jgi:hypothetical protein
MNRLLPAPIVLLALFAHPLSARVRIELRGRQFKVKEKITARVVNSTNHTIAYCAGVSTFGWSDKGDIVPAETISPFYVLHKGERGKWGTLADGVDFGNFWRDGSLDLGQTEEYSFKVRTEGEKRSSFEYTFDDAANMNCSDPHKKMKKVRSQTFTVH